MMMMMNSDTLDRTAPGSRQAFADAPEPQATAPVRHRVVHPRTPIADPRPAVAAAGASVFPPLLLLALAVVVWFGAQAAQLAAEYRQLGTMRAGLAAQTQAATRLRAGLDAVASATARLAGQGNANAQAVVQELRRRGVTIDPEKAPPKN